MFTNKKKFGLLCSGLTLSLMTASVFASGLNSDHRHHSRMSKMDSRSNSPVAWREDHAVFAKVTRSRGGRLQLRYTNEVDGTTEMSAYLPASARRVRDIKWLTNTDNVAFIADSDMGRDLYYCDAGMIKRISNSHDVQWMKVSSDGNTLTWGQGRGNHHSTFSLDMTERTVKLVE